LKHGTLALLLKSEQQFRVRKVAWTTTLKQMLSWVEYGFTSRSTQYKPRSFRRWCKIPINLLDQALSWYWQN